MFLFRWRVEERYVGIIGETILASNLSFVPAGQAGSEALCPKELGHLTLLMGGWVHLLPPGQLSHLWREVRWGPAHKAHWGVEEGYRDWWFPGRFHL